MIEKLKCAYLKIAFMLYIALSSSAFADNVMNANQMLRLMASHQASFEYCKAKYPQQMTARFGQETDAFEALVKINSFDQGSETVFRKMIHDQQDEFNKNKNIISKEIAAQTSIDDSDLCFWFVVQKTGAMAQVNQIVYDPQHLKFYLRIENHWFEGDIDGYGLTDCSCNEQNETNKDDENEKIKHREKLKAFIQKAKLEMGKGTSFYMSHYNENERQAYINVSTVIEHKSDTTSDQGDGDDLGLEFRNIQPIQSLPANVEYVSFFDVTGELYYECKINYINSSLTTCFDELIK
ncbi:hypothetical protein [Acinetobacter sp. CFCC 10889]|uniref:hypothetical protein n=1 Tax=Acinetobacter sp. CFCC 10889 TaxID=1775557 RepID=UPI000DCFF7DD|nr:hypothetical protein [Acinetobacter sp. CFCC 10889]